MEGIAEAFRYTWTRTSCLLIYHFYYVKGRMIVVKKYEFIQSGIPKSMDKVFSFVWLWKQKTCGVCCWGRHIFVIFMFYVLSWAFKFIAKRYRNHAILNGKWKSSVMPCEMRQNYLSNDIILVEMDYGIYFHHVIFRKFQICNFLCQELIGFVFLLCNV